MKMVVTRLNGCLKRMSELYQDDDDLLEEEMEKKLNEEIGGYQCVINVSALVKKVRFVLKKSESYVYEFVSPRDFAAV